VKDHSRAVVTSVFEAGVPTIRRAHAVQPVAALQSEHRCGGVSEQEKPLALEELESASCRSARSARIPHRKIDTRPRSTARTSKCRPALHAGESKANQAFVDWLTKFAERTKRTPAQIALAAAGAAPVIVPIPGTTKRHRLEENLGGVAIQPGADGIARTIARRHRSRSTARATLSTCRSWSGAEFVSEGQADAAS
jgi:aryl-alcohol dehydrogenase-like predicted oxidoreductase